MGPPDRPDAAKQTYKYLVTVIPLKALGSIVASAGLSCKVLQQKGRKGDRDAIRHVQLPRESKPQGSGPARCTPRHVSEREPSNSAP